MAQFGSVFKICRTQKWTKNWSSMFRSWKNYFCVLEIKKFTYSDLFWSFLSVSVQICLPKTRDLKLGLTEISDPVQFRLVSGIRNNSLISAIFEVRKLAYYSDNRKVRVPLTICRGLIETSFLCNNSILSFIGLTPCSTQKGKWRFCDPPKREGKIRLNQLLNFQSNPIKTMEIIIIRNQKRSIVYIFAFQHLFFTIWDEKSITIYRTRLFSH